MAHPLSARVPCNGFTSPIPRYYKALPLTSPGSNPESWGLGAGNQATLSVHTARIKRMSQLLLPPTPREAMDVKNILSNLLTLDCLRILCRKAKQLNDFPSIFRIHSTNVFLPYLNRSLSYAQEILAEPDSWYLSWSIQALLNISQLYARFYSWILSIPQNLASRFDI